MLRTCFVLQPQWNIINSKCHIYRKPGEVIATFYFFRIEFHFVEKFVFLYYSNSPLQIEHNYIQSLCFTLNLWYWMSHFYSTKYFYTAHKCQEVKSWWHFKYIWKNYFFLELYVFFLTKKNKTCFWNEKKRFHNMWFKELVILVIIQWKYVYLFLF